MRYSGLILVAIALMPRTLSAAEPFTSKWKAVDDAVKNGLPKTAIQELQSIIDAAVREKNPVQTIKGIGKKLSLEASLQKDHPEEKITRMQIEIEKSADGIKPILQLIQADWYFQYFLENRFRIMTRTQTAAGAAGFHISTWDVPRLLDEIDRQFQKALASAEALKKIPVSDYADLLEAGTCPDRYRPTLYDFLVYNALEFYAHDHNVTHLPKGAFVVSADSPIFSDVADYLAWKPEAPEDPSLVVTAIRLYQDLIRFHQHDTDKSALLEADLARLKFGAANAVGDAGSSRYTAALKRFAEKNADHEISARALSALAAVVFRSDDWVQAREIAVRGMERFPDSIGGRECRGMKLRIENDDARVSTERVWNKSRPTIDVTYRNMRKIYFRIVPFDFKAYALGDEWDSGRSWNRDKSVKEKLLTGTPELAWSVELPETKDYQERVEKIPAPDGVAPGPHFLVASFNEKFTEEDNQLSFTQFWVSDLALVIRSRSGAPVLEGFVLNAETGEPVADANVAAWYRPPPQGPSTPVEPTTTDKNGLFRFDLSQKIDWHYHDGLVYVSSGGQSLSNLDIPNLHGKEEATNAIERTVFFTDRAIYRPGQTIHFKAICFVTDLDQDKSRPIANRKIHVVLEGGLGLVDRLELTTNEFGSVSGTFTAPRNEKYGNMMIAVKDGQGPKGHFSFNIAEYKRPKFRVAVDAPQQAFRLNESVKVTGRAMAYSGAAIDGAKVHWRVQRQVRFPAWCAARFWWLHFGANAGEEIAYGRSATATDGSFEIEFPARPNLFVVEEAEPVFQYIVTADVTDTTGETRSGTAKISVGHTALAATISAEEWQTADAPVAIQIQTTTLDGEGQAAKGMLKVHALKQPDKVHRESLAESNPASRYRRRWDQPDRPSDPTNPNSWELGEVVFEQNVAIDATGKATVPAKLAAGIYRIKFKTADRFGKPVSAELPLKVLDPSLEKLAIKIPNVVSAPKWSVEPGEEFVALWGSGYDAARAFVEVEHRGKLLQNFWTQPGNTQLLIRQKVDESMRGGFTLRVTMVRENRAYMTMQYVEVPALNKNLTIKWERFVSKLQPAEKVTWTAVVSGPDASKEAAEMVATLYDASLDAFVPLKWSPADGLLRKDVSNLEMSFENEYRRFQSINFRSGHDEDVTLTYRIFPMDIVPLHVWWRGGIGISKNMRGIVGPEMGPVSAGMMDSRRRKKAKARNAGAEDDASDDDGQEQVAETDPANVKSPDLSGVATRKNLSETAFFVPHLMSDKDGTVRIEFTIPEALTEWKFIGFAHDRQMRTGFLFDKAVTSKELMVQPNPPRFVREGDLIEFTVKVGNQSTARQSGRVRLQFFDANMASVDKQLGNLTTDQAFDIPAGGSRSFSWKLSIPDGIGFLTYKAVGAGETLSDGEEGSLPVVPRRVLVTETLPLPLRGPGTKEFDFVRLRESAKSDSLQQQSLTIQMTSNPAWYAVMALPYLIEFPHECSEQTFNRVYANAVVRHLANGDPKIRSAFDAWKASGGDTLDSPLNKNQDLKSATLEETPWAADAVSESQARRNVGMLFDEDRLLKEVIQHYRRLYELQLEDGRWPWFPGGPANDYITLYITAGMGRMRELGIKFNPALALRSSAAMDARFAEMFRQIEADHRDKNNLSATVAFYLYARSFFLKDLPINAADQEAVNYWSSQAKTHWAELSGRQSQAHLAVALKRFGDRDTALAIMASIKERSVNNEELGMFWQDREPSSSWDRAPIETQAMMIEAFDEVTGDRKAVEDCKVWLIRQKQTRNWKTTTATADAVYALLRRGSNLLAADAPVEVTVGLLTIAPDKVEAGTGYYEKRFPGESLKPEFGRIKTTKTGEGVSWGGAYWQYLEDIGKITSPEGVSVKLTKRLYTKQSSKRGPVLKPVEGPVAVGDELVVKMTVTTDRDMEYVHLKDHRGSGTEPLAVLSGYRFQDGLHYYDSTRDTATHFFIDYLPKGTHEFEYSVRVQSKGQYQTGCANIQCMYAPEFNSHSESISLIAE